MRDFPADSVHYIMDSAPCADIARELGILEKIVGASRSALSTVGYIYKLHPTHWLAFSCFTGQKDTAENGISLMSYPKALFDYERVRTLHFNAIRAHIVSPEGGSHSQQ